VRNSCCSFLKRKFPQYNFDDNFFCTEIFDRNNNFKYTEVFLKLDSDYRVVMEEFKISEFKSFFYQSQTGKLNLTPDVSIAQNISNTS
jgi:hypothetical protein